MFPFNLGSASPHPDRHFGRRDKPRSRRLRQWRAWGLEMLEDRALLSVLDPDVTSLGAFPQSPNTYTITSYTDHATLTGELGGTLNATVTKDPATGQLVAVFPFDSIEVVAGETIRGVASGPGSLPVALLSQNDVVVDGGGLINFSGGSGSVQGISAAQAGAGGSIGGQGPGAGQPGRGGAPYQPGGGGGGGGFGMADVAGGKLFGSGGSGGLPGPVNDGAGGVAYDAELASTLQGGSGGGAGGWYSWGGGGGGALEIVANDTVKILGGGTIAVNGGPGGLEAAGNDWSYGGSGGGGSGGGLLIVGNTVDIEGAISAQGGQGANDSIGGAGGGGGGGCVLIVSEPDSFTHPGQINIQGGSGGSGPGAGTSGTDGVWQSALTSDVIPVIGALQANSDTVTPGTDVTLTASDVTGAGSAVTGVEFYGESDNTLDQFDVSSTGTAGSDGWSTTFSTAGWNPGTHWFTAQATTAAGTTSHFGTDSDSNWTRITVNVQPGFGSLAGPTITYGTATTTLSGHIAAGTYVPTGSVSIKLNGVTQTAAIDQAGDFSADFATATLGVAASPYTVTYAYPGATGFVPATNTASLTVNQATPTISWSNPANILVGTALGPAQLDATASVPGTFTYTPPPGTVLGVGNGQDLNVTFTPSDATDFKTVTDTVQINVHPLYHPAFDSLAGPTITYGTPAITLSGHIADGTNVPPGAVTIAVNGVTVQAPIDQTNGTFSVNFSTAALGVSASPYTVSYAYAGTTDFTPASAMTAVIVNKSQLTVSANTVSRPQYQSNPNLTWQITGFVPGDSSTSAVTGQPTLTAQASNLSPAGTYLITVGPGTLSAANYDFNFVPGTLTVTAVPTVPVSGPAKKTLTNIEKAENSMKSVANAVQTLETTIARLKSQGAASAVIYADQRALNKLLQKTNQEQETALNLSNRIVTSSPAIQDVLNYNNALRDSANAYYSSVITQISENIIEDAYD